jgi:hypothetical protein
MPHHRSRLFAVVLLSSAVLAGCGQSSQLPTRATPAGAGWQRAADSPLSPRGGAATVTVGDEVLVLGGSDAPPCPPNASCAGPQKPALRDGAAYDVTRDRWRPLAAAPVPLYSAHAVSLDGVVYVVTSGQVIGPRGGADDVSAAFLAYSVADDSWSRLPMVPGGIGQLVALRDGRLLSYEWSHEHGGRADSTYDVRSRAWSPLPRDPLAPSFDRTMVVTDTGDVVLLAVDLVDDPGVRPSLYRAAVWHPADGSWRELPRSEIVASDPTWWWSGRRVVNATRQLVDGGEVNNYGRSYPTGGLLDPSTGEWTQLPPWREDAPGHARGIGFSGAGDDVVVSGGWALRVGARRWTPLPAEEALPTQDYAVAVASNRVVVSGGARFGDDTGPRGELSRQTWVWSLPDA